MRSLIKKILFEEIENINTEDLKDLKTRADKYLTNNFDVHSFETFKNKNLELYTELLNANLLRKVAIEHNFDNVARHEYRKIYVYTWEGDDPTAYVGLTCDVVGRHKKHTLYCSSDYKRNTAVMREINRRKQEGIEPALPQYNVLTRLFSTEGEAADFERMGWWWYSNMGYRMLNKESAIGNLGSVRELDKHHPSSIWTTLEMNDINSIDELRNLDPILADYVAKNPEAYGLRGEKQRRSQYTIQQKLERAKELGKEKIFKDQYPSWYRDLRQSKYLGSAFQPEFKVEGDPKIYDSLEDVVTQYNIMKPGLTAIRNRLVKSGETSLKNTEGEEIKISYPNFMEERYRRRIEKIIMEIIRKKYVV